MKITHYGHACLLVETASARILFDPGTLSHGFEELRDLSAVLITHEHEDHLDVERLAGLLAANPDAQLIADHDSAAHLDDSRAVTAGDSIEFGDTIVTVLGGAHESIYANVPDCTNVGYLIDGGAFYHPGDSFVIPEEKVDVLALPVSGPWLKTADSIRFLLAVAPRVAIPMHEAALADTGTTYGVISAFTPEGTDFSPIEDGVTATI
jgi:L-ascorbate metabolism protein UlaG (beta-lactamase superfamily)